MFAERLLAGPELPHEALIDDNNLAPLLNICPVDLSAVENRDSEGGKDPRPDIPKSDLRDFAVR